MTDGYTTKCQSVFLVKRFWGSAPRLVAVTRHPFAIINQYNCSFQNEICHLSYSRRNVKFFFFLVSRIYVDQILVIFIWKHFYTLFFLGDDLFLFWHSLFLFLDCVIFSPLNVWYVTKKHVQKKNAFITIWYYLCWKKMLYFIRVDLLNMK